jgi:threonine/homoserine/homoserine lactone efflux protein
MEHFSLKAGVALSGALIPGPLLIVTIKDALHQGWWVCF